ncbi:MAG: bifunctional phosphoglucose/phosphomannose isomerase [Saprospiraceae bacterium]|nr:bifunctional phosphoglucose/phosphomannose isomerase [Saprospiraceae bacterium]
MYKYIDQFPFHLKNGLSTIMTTPPSETKITNIVIAGMGGSGIGAEFTRKWIEKDCIIPLHIVKDYNIPAFVNKHTLFIASSYSGNTEETLEAVEQAEKSGAFMAVITSGGQLMNKAKMNQWAFVQLPDNIPAPRAALGYSVTAQIRLIQSFGLLKNNMTRQIRDAVSSIIYWKEEIQHQAQIIAGKIAGKISAIYTSSDLEPVGLRFRQQIAENGKSLAWHHVLPEMNHNELVGWTSFNPNLVAIFIRSSDESKRLQMRMNITEDIISQYAGNQIEIWPKGKGLIGESLYLVHLLDWISYYIAEIQGVDVMEIDVINYLKESLQYTLSGRATKVA